jgi:Putative peptidoglycan binding domain
MASPAKHRKRRAVITGVVCVALIGGVIALIAVRNTKTKTAAAAASIFKTATVSTGDLTTSERVDGTVQLSSTLAVLHRIEGQESSSVAPSASAATTPTATTPQRTNGATNQNALSSPLSIACSSTTVPTTQPSTTTTPASTTTTTTIPDTTPAQTSTTTSTTTTSTTTTTTTLVPTTSTSTSTTVEATQPSTTTTTAPIPCDTTTPSTTTTTTTTTTTVVPPNTTLPAGPSTSRGATGGGGGGTTTARSATGGSGSSTSNVRITQTITSIIGVNTAIQPGDVLYTVDGAPVVALDGALPAWRSLSTASADGADIAQLETSLVALGYDPAQKVTVDGHFDSATKTMVEAWQTGLGIKATGTVPLGSVVFLPSSTTVSSVARVVGDTVGDGDTVLTLATPSQDVLVDVPAGDEAQVVPGLTVAIGTVQGTVTRLRSADRSGAVVVEAVIAPSAPIQGATNGSAVKVTLTLQDAAGVLIAPADALVSRLDGTYAVQVQTTDGTTKWLTVDLLGVSGGNIAIRGDGLSQGTVLLVPA